MQAQPDSPPETETPPIKAKAADVTGKPIIEAKGITKRYGAVTALDNVDFTLCEGEVVGLVGDNGAGKSTLIKILSGAVQPDAGEIRVNGERVDLHNPKVAQGLGIETVYQDLALFEDLSIAANIFLGREKKGWGGLLDHAGMLAFSQEVIRRFKVDVPEPRINVRSLSGGQRQAVAVARAVAFGTRVVILDEPTSALSKSASDQVLDIVRDLKSHGLSVIVISHNLEHVMGVADRIVVLRRGQLAGELPRGEATLQRVVELMVGG
jgi:ABC-type sugar transport system ATPase subunit